MSLASPKKASTRLRLAAEARAQSLSHVLTRNWHIVDRAMPHERLSNLCRRCLYGVEINVDAIHVPGEFNPRPAETMRGRAVEQPCPIKKE